MNELDEVIMHVEAQRLIYDLANGCTVKRYGSVLLWMVTPIPGHPAPRTKGQVGDAAVGELASRKMVEIIGSTPPQTCRLTAHGEAYCQHHPMQPAHIE